LSLDAILRSLSRRFISGKHMLEWETAAQAESGAGKRTQLDWYLRLSPVLSIVIAVMLVFDRPPALLPAAPVLWLWAVAPGISRWLNSSLRRKEAPLSEQDTLFLEQQALAIWRYFADFGGEENHWLIPDNVEEHGLHQVRKLSPTNLGMLLNARQAAVELGFLTVPEFAHATLGTLTTYDKLEKQRGHIYNWYDMETLKAIPPFIVSAVDSGNLAAGFYALHAGALELLKRPVLQPQAFRGLELVRSGTTGGRVHPGSIPSLGTSSASSREPAVQASLLRSQVRALIAAEAVAVGSGSELRRREHALSSLVEDYLPWLLPEFDALFAHEALREMDVLPLLEDAGLYEAELEVLLDRISRMPDGAVAEPAARLRGLLPVARERSIRLRQDVAAIATLAERHAEAMEYGFLLVKERQLLSIGYDGKTGELHSACYDLLASEARIASFLAVAKSDIPQQSWFRLDRSHVLVEGRACLLSWTGTMFEYLMPALWMRTFPNTLIARSLEAAVSIQRTHVRGIPWGISESGFAKMDELGRYGYQAWGIPKLALKYGAEDGPVISPYSTFLTLSVLRTEAIRNLRKMTALGWGAAYGFYEAADYTGNRKQPEMVRSWMAHHQGMSLLAVTNLLRDDVFQRWFHANARVRAAELLLHEKPLSKDTLKSLEERKLVEG